MLSHHRRERRWSFQAQVESLEPRWLLSSDLTSGDSLGDVSWQGAAVGELAAAAEPGVSIALPGGASMVNPTFGSTFRSSLGGGVGYWDAASSWSEGRAPTANDRVILAAGDTLVIRDTAASAHSITIHEGGKLAFASDVNTELKVITLVVLGELEMGTAAAPIAAGVTAKLTIRNVAIDTLADPGQWGNGLVVLGKIRVHGAVKEVGDNRLSVEPRVGDTTLTFERDVTGWKAGDKLFLPGTKQLDDYHYFGLQESMQWENLTIASVSGKVVTLTSALTYDHLGARNSTGALEFMAAVQNLSRNAIIKSESATETRGHTLFAGRADVDIRYAQFGGLGRSRLGDTSDFRLPVHFYHLLGPTTPQANGYQYTFVGNAITCPLDPMPFKWGLVINDSHFGLIQNNDLNNWAGAGLVTLTGAETQNVIEGNRVMRIQGNGLRVDTVAESGVGFWFRGPDNYVRNNVAANIATDRSFGTTNPYAYGFNAAMATQLGNVAVPAFQGADPSQVGQALTVNMNLRPFREFRGNETFATYNGMTLWWVGTFYESPGDVESQLADMKIWNTYNWGIFLYESNRLVIDNLRYITTDTARTPLRTAVYFADYMARQMVIQNSRIENGWVGLPLHTDVRGTTAADQTVGRITIKDTTVVRGGIGAGPPSSVNGSTNLAKRVVLLMNVQFLNSAKTLWLTDQAEGGMGAANLGLENYFVVHNYNSPPGVEGEDFIVQAPYLTGSGTQLPDRPEITGKIYPLLIDTAPPTLSNIAASGITAAGATISGTASENAAFQVRYGPTTAYGQTLTHAGFATSRSLALTNLQPGTTYHYQVVSWDAYGNLVSSGDQTFTTSGASSDTTPPAISGVASSSITSSSAAISWTTDEAADTQVEYGTTTSYGNSTTLNSTLVASHAVNLAGLSAGTTYHYRVRSRDAVGNLSVSGDFTFTTLAPTPNITDWGTIAFSSFNNLNLAGPVTWYSFTATRSGKGTVEAFFNHAAGNIDLEVYDGAFQLLGASATSASSEQIDIDATGGAKYYVKLSGANADVDARVTNLVGIAGTAISVFGTSADDTFGFVDGNSHQISVNGVSYWFGPSTVGQVTYSGDAGNDTLQVTLGGLDDSATLRPGQLDVTNAAYQVQGSSLETVSIAAGTGLDKVWFYDTAGNDTFTANPNSAQFVGAGMNNTASGFDEVRAYGTAGGTDIASLYDSSGNDYFDAGPASGLLRGTSYYSYAERFDKVYAYSTAGGYDMAKLYDSLGIDYFDAGPASGLLQGTGFYNWADRFDEVIAYSTAGGNDIANLYGSIGSDVFSTTSNTGKLTGSGFSLTADQFEQSKVYGQGGADTAQFREVRSVDKVYGRSNYAQLTASSKKTIVYDFALVEAYAMAGQRPTANVRNVDYIFKKYGTWR